MDRSAKASRNRAISSRSRRAQFFAAGVVATNAWTRKIYGKDFDRLAASGARGCAQDAGAAARPRSSDFDGKQFFEALLQITMEGFFADPIYGGNRNKASWRMVGFPGLPAVYSNLIDEYRNKRYAGRTAIDRRLLVRGARHGDAIEGSRCGHGRHGLDRQHHGARADQGGPDGGRARARRRSDARRGLRAAAHPRRAEIHLSAGADAGSGAGDASPSATVRRRSALPMRRMGFVPAGQQRRRSSQSLGRPALALSAERSSLRAATSSSATAPRPFPTT